MGADAAVEITGIAAGGDGVGRLPDGRAVFVRGAVPGDRVEVAVHDDRRRFARGRAVAVLDAGPGRVAPPCPLVGAGCGGCGWQHVDPAAQRRLRAQIVVDALTRIGRLDGSTLPPVDPGPDLPVAGYRTTVKAAVDPASGRAAFRVHHGHDLVPVDPGAGCLVAHPLVDDVLRRATFAGTAVTVRAGAATGERLVVADGAEGLPPATSHVTPAALRGGARAWFHEEVAGHRFRVSASSFFQARPDGAAALVGAAGAALGDQEHDHLVDLYAGVGLFAALLPARRTTAVESSASAVADARHNLAHLGSARIVRADVRRWRPSPADAVLADPSRHGLGAGVVDRIAATGAGRVALVSCDPGALGRDAGLLAAAGYRLASIALVDLFPHTPHVEVVTGWRRGARTPTAGSGGRGGDP